MTTGNMAWLYAVLIVWAVAAGVYFSGTWNCC
jgi:hypothetical protein